MGHKFEPSLFVNVYKNWLFSWKQIQLLTHQNSSHHMSVGCKNKTARLAPFLRKKRSDPSGFWGIFDFANRSSTFYELTKIKWWCRWDHTCAFLLCPPRGCEAARPPDFLFCTTSQFMATSKADAVCVEPIKLRLNHFQNEQLH